MKKAIIITFCLCSILTKTALSQTVEWQGIILLHSTRADVEKIFGNPINKELDIYDMTTERITLWYSRGGCKEHKLSAWNVPKDTVVGILISPRGELNVRTVKDKLNQEFERQIDMEMPNVFIYYNNDNSIKFQTRLLANGVEDVDFIAYSPGKSGKDLRCKSAK